MPNVPHEVETAVAALEAATIAVEDAEKALMDAKAALHQMRTVTVPEVFNRYGITMAETPSGARARNATFITGSMPSEEDDAAAHDLAVQHALDLGWEEFIKSKVIGEWGRGERAKALEAFNHLRGDNSATVKLSEGIHHSTLQASVRRGLQDGTDIPMNLDVLGIQVLDGVRLTKRSIAAQSRQAQENQNDE